MQSMLIGMQDLTANKLFGHLFFFSFAILEKSLYHKIEKMKKMEIKMEINVNELR